MCVVCLEEEGIGDVGVGVRLKSLSPALSHSNPVEGYDLQRLQTNLSYL